MKIALCLSGQPRNIDSTFSKIKQSILDGNDVDVFIHTWFDENNLSTNSVIPDRVGDILDASAIQKLKDFYNPKKILVENPKNWKRKYHFPNKCFVEGPSWALDVKEGLEVAKSYLSNMTNSMFYSIMISNLLKEDYSISNGVEYDLVVRCRTDFSPHVVIDFDKISLNDDEIICHSTGLPYNMPHDWFSIGTTESMNVYCGVYNQINQLHKQSNETDGWWCNELLIKHHLMNNKIKVHHANLLVYRG
jgi:hypothetical protein